MVVFDLDGVIAKYVPSDYKDADGKENFKFLRKGYFLEREVDPFALGIFRSCVRSMPDETFAITGVSDDIQHKNRLTIDKLIWTNNKAPEFDIGSKFISTSDSKAKVVELLRGRPLTKRDILIDDYNKNLYSWIAAGGTAIKYINEYNSVWDGYIIDSREFNKEDIDCENNKKMIQDAFHSIVHIMLEA